MKCLFVNTDGGNKLRSISTKAFLVLYQVFLWMHLRGILYILIVLDITNTLLTFSFI